MLAIIPLITFFSFGVFHLLCFWFIDQKAFPHDFNKFNLGLTNFVAGLGIVILLFINLPMELKLLALAWKAILLTVSQRAWKRKVVKLWPMTIISICGIGILSLICGHYVPLERFGVFVISLAGCIFASAIFTMNMGHWYLNVAGLDIRHLVSATKVFLYLLILRFCWNVFSLMTVRVEYFGDLIRLPQFLTHMDGFLLLMAIVFGTLLPLILTYFVFGTLKVKSTQSATGILYVIVTCMLMGDLSYKYYWIKYGLLL